MSNSGVQYRWDIMERIKFKREELRKYFPSGYTEEQMRRDIIKGLELLKRQRERNRDAR